MMSLAYAVATPDTNDASMLAARGPLPESFKMLAGLGYSGVDLMLRDPVLLNAAEIGRMAADCNLAIVAVSTGQLGKEDGLSLSHADASIRSRSLDRARAVIEFAATFGADVNIGGLRGRLGASAQDREAAMGRARTSYALLAAHAAKARIQLCLEPQCRYFSDWLPTLASAAEWNAQFGEGCLAVLADLYHMMLEEESVHTAFIRELPRISAIQFSDTNRRAPGMGHWNFDETLRILAALGYSGGITIECQQLPDTRGAAARAASCILPNVPAC
ncbi:MAG: sugar phosphate isomerase/epimerase family protein [Acidobacteriota bacterium]